MSVPKYVYWYHPPHPPEPEAPEPDAPDLTAQLVEALEASQKKLEHCEWAYRNGGSLIFADELAETVTNNRAALARVRGDKT